MLITCTAPWDKPVSKNLFGMSTRWAGWWFTSDGVGLIKEKRWKDRTEIMWRLDADGTRTQLWSRMYQVSIYRFTASRYSQLPAIVSLCLSSACSQPRPQALTISSCWVSPQPPAVSSASSESQSLTIFSASSEPQSLTIFSASSEPQSLTISSASMQ